MDKGFKMVFRAVVLCFYISLATDAFSQSSERIPLYDDSSETGPAIYLHLVQSQEPRPTVLVIPGGGYQMLAMDHEGTAVAKWFNEKGVNAIILEYSLGEFDGSGSKHPAMLNDAKRAMRYIRNNAKQWNVNPDMIAVIGFSAGGHLASTLSTHSDSGNLEADLAIDRQSCVPNLCILFYPVIMMEGPNTHWGSRRFLLGPTPDLKDVQSLSNDQHVNVTTPPTILFHTSDDAVVPVQNSINYYLALRKIGIPSEMHIFEHGAHGKGLVVDDFALGQWSDLLENWLTRWKWIDSKNINK